MMKTLIDILINKDSQQKDELNINFKRSYLSEIIEIFFHYEMLKIGAAR